jgi:hypothetical protein
MAMGSDVVRGRLKSPAQVSRMPTIALALFAVAVTIGSLAIIDPAAIVLMLDSLGP